MAVMLQEATTLYLRQFHIGDDVKLRRFTKVAHKVYT
jgi:hypothetical protein